MPLRPTKENANELRSVAPLVVMGAKPQLVGSCTLVTNGVHTIAFSSAEVLRQAGDPLVILTKLDGSHSVPVPSWMMGRHASVGIIDLGTTFPQSDRLDVAPLPIAAVCATVDTRGGTAAIVTVQKAEGKGFSRRIVPVQVDAMDGGGMSDDITRLASPIDALDVDAPVDGAALFAWLPSDPVLGRKPETVVVALGVGYRNRIYKPRELPAIAELVGLEDLGRAMPINPGKPEGSNELSQIAGEIKDVKE